MFARAVALHMVNRWVGQRSGASRICVTKLELGNELNELRVKSSGATRIARILANPATNSAPVQSPWDGTVLGRKLEPRGHGGVFLGLLRVAYVSMHGGQVSEGDDQCLGFGAAVLHCLLDNFQAVFG